MPLEDEDDPWTQPTLYEHPTKTNYLLHGSRLFRERQAQGLEGPPPPGELRRSWNCLTLDEREAYYRPQAQAHFEAAIAKFNARYPLSPSVSGESSDSDAADEGGVTDRRGMQRWNRYRRDYRKRTFDDNSRFPFLRLPVDLRRIVYEQILGPSTAVQQMRADGSGRNPNGPFDLRLAMTSKELFKEVLGFFLEYHTIIFEILPESSAGLPILADPDVLSAQYWPFSRITHLHIFISLNYDEQSNFVVAELQKLINMLPKCSALSLRITGYCAVKTYTESINEVFDRTITCLEQVHGLRELIFSDDPEHCGPLKSNSMEWKFLGTDEKKRRLQGITTLPKVFKD